MELEIAVLPADFDNELIIKKKVLEQTKLKNDDIEKIKIIRRSIDARSKTVVFRLRVQVFLKGDELSGEPFLSKQFHHVENSPRVIIVGAGPAGYFAALDCLMYGLKPVIVDRGKDVRARRRDLRAIQQFGIVNENSNYCFGEGGAGTYSDGKLYTRSHKRGSIEKSLLLLVEHGANSDILIDAHPHIGSNKLPLIITNIRETILHYGGEVHFGQKVTDFILKDQQILGVVCNDSHEYLGKAVILATGHSARDIYELLFRKQIFIEPKPFALGVRIEHPQALIDEIQYRQNPRDYHLPAAAYSLVCQVKNKGVFSFCMCPGGIIVPAATAPGEIVVNGMSMSRRDSKYANSGTVTSIELSDFNEIEAKDPFVFMRFQQKVEQQLFQAGDGSQKAPAQRLPDFISRKLSATLPDSSYIPGLTSQPLHQLLPKFVYNRLQQGVQEFGKMMRGYMTSEAVVVGTESRTSSPIRIPRVKETLQHPQIQGLFPCGEGAGYAGGILSAAMDGQNVAFAIKEYLKVS